MSGEKVTAEDVASRIWALFQYGPNPGSTDFVAKASAYIRKHEQAAREEEAEEIAKMIHACVGDKPPAADASRDYVWYPDAILSICRSIRQRHAKSAAPKTATEANIVAERDKDYVRAIVNEVLEDRLESSKARVREIVREEIRARTSELRPMIEQLNTIVQLLSKMP